MCSSPDVLSLRIASKLPHGPVDPLSQIDSLHRVGDTYADIAGVVDMRP